MIWARSSEYLAPVAEVLGIPTHAERSPFRIEYEQPLQIPS